MRNYLIVISCVFMFSCNNDTNDHGHEHEEEGIEALSYTLYSDKTEIFVEFNPLIAGSTTKFAAHFTVLGENFTPLTEGTVTVSLIVNGKGIKQSVSAPSSPGIYQLTLQPKNSGTGDLIFDIQTKDFTDRQVIKNVTVYPDEKSALNDQKTASSGSNEISYLKEQAWKVEFANAPVIKQSFNNMIKTSGQILSAPGDEMIITAKAGGIVRFAPRTSVVGSMVSKGTALFIITGGDISEDNLDVTIDQAKSLYEKAKADFERSGELVKDKIVSEREYQQDKVAFENARAAYNMISKGYSSAGQNIAAPMNGYIRNIMVSEGQFVQAGAPLATISKNSRLILQANVSQKYYDQLPSVSSANFKTSNSEKFISTEMNGGRLISYGKSANPGSPFIPISFEINNIEGIIPGSVAEVYLKFNEIQNALVIPVTALIEEQGSFYVYVQTAGESFQKREVKLGAADGIQVQVLSGLSEGERVVTKGAYQIKLSMASGALPAHGHEH